MNYKNDQQFVTIMSGLYGANYASKLNEQAIYQNYKVHPEAFINAYNQKVSSQIQAQQPSIAPAQMPGVQVQSAPVELAQPAQGSYDPNIMERVTNDVKQKAPKRISQNNQKKDNKQVQVSKTKVQAQAKVKVKAKNQIQSQTNSRATSDNTGNKNNNNNNADVTYGSYNLPEVTVTAPKVNRFGTVQQLDATESFIQGLRKLKEQNTYFGRNPKKAQYYNPARLH